MICFYNMASQRGLYNRIWQVLEEAWLTPLSSSEFYACPSSHVHAILPPILYRLLISLIYDKSFLSKISHRIGISNE